MIVTGYSWPPSMSTRLFFLNPFGTRTQISCTHLAGRRQLLFLTNCSDDSKLYMICVALKGLSESHRVSYHPSKL